MGWKTVYINEECKVSLSLNAMKVKIEDNYINVPIQDIQTVVFAHDKMTISLPLINALVMNNVSIIITNQKQDPTGIFLPFNQHSVVFKQLKQQIDWKLTRKKKLWKMIVQEKIKGEISLMKLLDIEDRKIEIMMNYLNTVENDDKTNREGSAARCYFENIYGEEFIRNSESNYNYGMNYGYKIIASYISRYLASRGYLVQLGIHHIGESNPFNLTYDFIEPFRVLVDLLVLNTVDNERIFSMEDRYEIVNITNYTVHVGHKKYRLSDAIEIIMDSYLSFLEERTDKIQVLNYEKLYEFKRKD